MTKKKGNEATREGSLVSPPKAGTTTRRLNLILCFAIAIVTVFVFLPCLNSELVNWDDPGYVIENRLVRDISPNGIKEIFSTPVMGNYHPLTILSLAINYQTAHLDPETYHLTSLLFHLIATILVFWLVWRLAKSPVTATITSLLFAIHPMHVESVAWVSGRKDVVYGVFFVAALIAYDYYLLKYGLKKWLIYLLALLLFLSALLSKPVAVSLAPTLLLIDFLKKRKLSASLFIEKIPFFALAVIFGLKSVHDQSALGALDKTNLHFNFFDLLTLGSYTLVTYLWKAVAPVDLSCFYTYPVNPEKTLYVYLFVYPGILLALAFLCWRFLRHKRAYLFGIAFFVVNIALLLQIIPVGGAVIAERYTYIPYIGLFFMVGWLANYFWEKGRKQMVLIGAVPILILLGIGANLQCRVWHDTMSLWTAQLNSKPGNEYGTNSIGAEYFARCKASKDPTEKQALFDSAGVYLNKAIAANPAYFFPYLTLGMMARSTGNMNEAKRFFDKAMQVGNEQEKPKALLGLGIMYFMKKQIDSSQYFLEAAIKGNPRMQEAHANYANILDLRNFYEAAIKEYGIAIDLNPESYESYLNRARAFTRIRRYTEALADFNKAIELSPENGECYYSRAQCYYQMGNKQDALKDVQQAMTLGYTGINQTFYESLTK